MIQVPPSPRFLVEAHLRPVQGTRFQPTGFPDIGASTYQLADGTEMLLVESAQSMANRMEAVCWDTARQAVIPLLEGMPHVVVTQGDEPLTSSLLEAHRLNSVYVEHTAFFKEQLTPKIGYDKRKPVDLRRLAAAMLFYDPNSLVHGTFLESVAGVLRLPRALSGFIEARGVRVVSTGGVKNDRVTPQADKEAKRSAKEGFGNVPFHRDEYTASEIVAYFNLDLAQLRTYGLSNRCLAFLVGLSQWKIRAVLEDGLRLRTACDLEVTDLQITRPEGGALPERGALEGELRRLIGQIRAEEPQAFGPAPTIAEYTGK